MASGVTGTLDEAYQRLHATGPEFDGWLSNHGPMAAEAMVRHGHADQVHRWLDGYMERLEEFPRGSGPIGPDWQDALGDPRRIADWTAYFRREVTEQPWRQVLATWWPRLLPGVAAAATHGVIRVGHAVRALMQDGADAEHLAELAHGLAYWAARWQPVPGVPAAGLPPIPARTRRRNRPGPAPRLPMRWPRSRGSPISRAVSATGSPGSAGYRAGPPRWRRRGSRHRPGRSRPGWAAWSMPPPSGICGTGTATASCSCTPPPPPTRSCGRFPRWMSNCGHPA